MPDGWGEVEPRRASSPSGPSPLIGLVVGLAVVAFLVWRGHHLLPAALLLVVVVLTVGRWLNPTFDRVTGRVLHAVGHGVGVALTWIVFVPFTLLVVTPVWLVLRVLRWDPLGPTTRRRGRWADRPRARQRTFPERLYTDERERGRSWRTSAHGAIAALACCVLAVGAGLLAYEGWQRITAGDGPAEAAADTGVNRLAPTLPAWQHFEIQPWSEALARGEGQTSPQYDPLLVWRNVDRVESPYLNVEDGARVSYRPAATAGEPLDVWFFGGSAAFGYNQRDDHTIASELVRLAEQRGIPVHIENFGTVAYTNFQETLLLGELLTTRPPPDLIVFYDGMNDLSMYLTEGGPTRPAHLFSTDIGTLLAQNRAALDFPVVAGDAAAGPPDPAVAASLYDQGVELSHHLADSYGVPILTYYQPSIYTMTGPVDPRVLEVIRSSQADIDYQRGTWAQARAALGPDVIDVAGSLDGVDGTLFYDWVHHNERAAGLIAAAMYPTFEAQLQPLVAAGAG